MQIALAIFVLIVTVLLWKDFSLRRLAVICSDKIIEGDALSMIKHQDHG